MSRPSDDFVRRRPRGAAGWVLFLVVAAAFLCLEKRPGRPAGEGGSANHLPTPAPSASSPGAGPQGSSSPPASIPQAGDSDFAALARERRQRVAVIGGGTVTRVLPDDTEGDRHQRFLIRLDGDGGGGGGSILIAHNIDLAERVPVREGDSIRFAGEYVWNDRGGVVHWTHRDPAHKHPDGYIEHNGRRYQ